MQGFAEASGMTVEELAESYGMDDSSIEEAAKDDVKGRLVAKTIALKENIKLTDDIYLKKLVEMMESDEKNPDLNTLEKDYIDTTSVRPKDDAYVQLVKDFLMEKWNEANK
jgi:FKBP-type peptidyl-prolyl cis-trans isomerase (trigger factor)